ncbi:bile acid:Na+ symporter, BASS family [Paracoccus isoporae]|uniref:Bile acid:Na+ symporter, BASS family n=1 Tax=Paracoccus isoporae TaxID=591205 RepID=A0A1G6T0J6_9RHOB|nr:hypothetical protein [Paracoccus isoporae]SDD21987.1 bile acid:Na+ symporter, BASS family [Paracoccus isoporae]
MTILLSLSLAVVMFSAGLGLRGGVYLRLLRMPRAILTGLALQMIVLPVWALLLTRLMDLSVAPAVGLMLTAMAPATTASHVLVGLAGGHVGLARSLTAISTPLFLLWVLPTGPDPTWLMILSGLILLPFFAGMTMARIARGVAAKLARPVSLAASLLTGLLLLQALIRYGTVFDLRMLVASVALAGGAVLAAWLAARLLAPGQGPAVGISTAMQNCAIAVVIAEFANIGFAALVPALYGVVMYAVPFALIAWRARRR